MRSLSTATRENLQVTNKDPEQPNKLINYKKKK